MNQETWYEEAAEKLIERSPFDWNKVQKNQLHDPAWPHTEGLAIRNYLRALGYFDTELDDLNLHYKPILAIIYQKQNIPIGIN